MTPFVLFGRSHLTALVLSLIIPAALVALTRATRRVEAPIRWILAAILFGVLVWWYVLAYHRGWLTIGDGLPILGHGEAAQRCGRRQERAGGRRPAAEQTRG